MIIERLFLGLCGVACVTGAYAAVNPQPGDGISAYISLKVPGNDATTAKLEFKPAIGGAYSASDADGRVSIVRTVSGTPSRRQINVVIKALDDIYFNYGEKYATGFRHNDNQYYMPGFWYRQNLRSSEGAPSFRESDSWLVREDRLSTPLTAVFSPTQGRYVTVLRLDALDKDALTTHSEGEVVISGETTIGYTGFENVNGTTCLCYGFPYREAPKSYIRKLTLAPEVEAYQMLRRGDELTLNWEIAEAEAQDFAGCVKGAWEYSYDTFLPAAVESAYTPERIKEVISNFYTASYVADQPLCYYAGVGLATASCSHSDVAEIGFLGRTLLNAFNALEYGEEHNRKDLVDGAEGIYTTYLNNGFTPSGVFKEVVRFARDGEEPVKSIRRQSEGTYAVLNYLKYEKDHGRRHKEWELRVRTLLDYMLTLQRDDGSFPRKFNDDRTVVDSSGGSTPSATLPLIMGYKFFGDKRYLVAARRSVDYLDRELISKSDYFSSTLDANCEDKEAALYAATATYYLALVTKGDERKHCADLARKAAYFALSWYYTWDVPFARGQMLGDVGLKTRGWGNVSVENNHIDVFVFEFADVLRWLGRNYDDNRFTAFAEVISSSMSQLLPFDKHMCSIAKVGYYPEVVQHTNWDYGRNGKGYYNNIFAPGWTVASLWQLYTPGRAEWFLASKI